MGDASPSVIHWFRRDLRLRDNSALHHAQAASQQVIPAYILSDWSSGHPWTGPKRQQFLCNCLNSLASDLEGVGGKLTFRTGDPVDELVRLAQETGSTAIFYNEDPDPHGNSVELGLQRACRAAGIECRGFHDHTLHTPQEVLTQTDQPYRVFTPYYRNWIALPKQGPVGVPGPLNTPSGIPSAPPPDLTHWSLQTETCEIPVAGEKAALARLESALEHTLASYHSKRDIPAVPGTSRLSQDLRFGLLSIHLVYQKVEAALQSAGSTGAKEGFSTYLKELAWREFYMAILKHFPKVLDEEFNPVWRGLPWNDPGEDFERWKTGQTGFPIIDAGMRELLHTGFMHNRVRMITAMFLTKDLHIDWRLGESFFMQHLLDGEIASNNGGWQWSAGTGADAAPYFRIQNPWTQSKRFDSEGLYIKHWVPELAKTAPKQLHAAPASGEPVAPDYPTPCVDHAAERLHTLDIFKRHRAMGDR